MNKIKNARLRHTPDLCQVVQFTFLEGAPSYYVFLACLGSSLFVLGLVHLWMNIKGVPQNIANPDIPVEIRAIAVNDAQEYYGVYLEVRNPPNNTRNIVGVRAVVVRGEFDGDDLSGKELVPLNEVLNNPISLNPGDNIGLKMFSEMNRIHSVLVSFSFKNKAGVVQALNVTM